MSTIEALFEKVQLEDYITESFDPEQAAVHQTLRVKQVIASQEILAAELQCKLTEVWPLLTKEAWLEYGQLHDFENKDRRWWQSRSISTYAIYSLGSISIEQRDGYVNVYAMAIRSDGELVFYDTDSPFWAARAEFFSRTGKHSIYQKVRDDHDVTQILQEVTQLLAAAPHTAA